MPSRMPAKSAATAAVFATLIAVHYLGIVYVFVGVYAFIFLVDLPGTISEMVGRRATRGQHVLAVTVLLARTAVYVAVGWLITFCHDLYHAYRRQHEERVRRRDARETARAAKLPA